MLNRKCLIYVASSWKNPIYDEFIKELVKVNNSIEIYNFKTISNFHWSDISKNYSSWSISNFIYSLRHRKSVNGFISDYHTLKNCDICILLMPCGLSAHLELGAVCGMDKLSIVYFPEELYNNTKDSLKFEPELMYKMATWILNDKKILFSNINKFIELTFN